MGPPGQGRADAALARLTAQIALELALAKPGKDDGLLPVNSLLGEIEETCQTLPVSGEVRQAVTEARRAVEEAFEAGAFTAEGLERLRAWTVGMQRTLATAGETPVPQHPTATGGTPAPQAGAGEELCLDPAQDAEMLRAFVDESREHLHQIEQGVLALERNPQEASTLHAIFRAFHTIKGGAGFLHLGPIQALAHELESLLEGARQGRMAMEAGAIDLILTGSDLLGRWVGELEAQLEGAMPPGSIRMPAGDLIERIRGWTLEGGAAAKDPEAPSGVGVSEVPGAAEGNSAGAAAPGEAAGSRQTCAGVTDPPRRVGGPGLQVTGPAPSPGGSWEGPGSSSAGVGPETCRRGSRPGVEEAPRTPAIRAGTPFVRVHTQKLDALVDLVGELVIAQSLVTGDAGVRALADPGLSRHLSQLGRVTAELQRTAMALRLVPIRATFEKMARLVRDLSLQAGKQVELELHGEDTELDRHLIDELDDPLVHMIRNAVDHGIEAPEVRVARGKPPRGVIALAASHRAGHVVIEVRDDGAGLDRERIVAKARRQGLIGEGENPGEAEVLRLLFTPGFSTAERVTEISGRGVGMDVVWRNITDLRGQVTADSVLGQGTTFAIHLPLTLAIIDGLLVGVGGQRFVLPTLAVRESFRPTREMVSRAGPRGEVVNVRGRLCPLLRLHEHLGIEPRRRDPTEAVVVVVESNREQRCVMVDELLGKQEVVIKSLGERFRHNRVLAGAAILGDGRVGLILEADALVRPRGARGRDGGWEANR